MSDSSYSEENPGVGEHQFLSTYLEAFSWLRIAVVVFFVLLAIGFAIDKLSGPLTEQTKLGHAIAGIFGAVGVIYAIVVGAIALIGAVIIYQESRIR